MTGKASKTGNAIQANRLPRFEVSVGQSVLVNPEEQGLEYVRVLGVMSKPTTDYSQMLITLQIQVGKIVGKRGDNITLQWFYRPEDTFSGRKVCFVQGWRRLYNVSHVITPPQQHSLGMDSTSCFAAHTPTLSTFAPSSAFAMS